MKRLLIGNLIFVSVLFGAGTLMAQPIDAGRSARNYFRNPLSLPLRLTANFGELRPDHWHMGLDIRTNARENQPVYAAAEGYIAHVGIRPQGFGRFIIINHPNGLSTLYAHLNNFNESLQAFVTEQQYQQEKWSVELDFTKDQFPVSKGGFIAYSGNTGGSQGPHLHFEIFETSTLRRLNPLLFDFDIVDKFPPTLTRLAMYDRSKSIYSQTPVLYTLQKTSGGYIIPKNKVIKTGLQKISFGLQAIDRTEAGGSPNGIYSAQLYWDEEPVIAFVIDSILFEERVYMNAHIDYRYDYRGGPYIQLLTELPGNRCPVYKKIKGDGMIELSDTAVHAVSIDVKDTQGNVSQLNFLIQFDSSLAKGSSGTVGPQLVPNRENELAKPGFKLKLRDRNLYDTVPAYYTRNNNASGYAVTALHQVNDPSYPVHGEVVVSIQPEKALPDEWKDKLLMKRGGKSSSLRKATWKDGWITASHGDFGPYQVFADLVPPQINAPGKGDTVNLSSAKRIVFTPTDNYSVIKNFRVDLNGKFLLFTNDKTRNWIYTFDERWPYGVHELKATATDLAGNTTVKTWWIKRAPYTAPPPRKKSTKKSSSKKK
jgi:hypothetical protein